MVVDLVTKQQVLETIAARAITPLERQLQDLEREANLSAPRLQARLASLSTQVGADDDAALERWLAQSGLSRVQIAFMLSSSCWDEEATLPAWIEALDEILCGFGGSSQR